MNLRGERLADVGSFACPLVLKHKLKIDQTGTVHKFQGDHPIEKQHIEKAREAINTE